MQIVFLGTPEFAIPSCQSLLQAPQHTLLAVVTQPDRPKGRGQQLSPPPVKAFCDDQGILCYQTRSISRDPELLEQLRALKPDLLITAAFGQLLSQEVLELARLGVWNVHASLLPRWRGAAPIQRALLAGDRETGISIMQTVLELDAGDVLKQASLSIQSTDNAQTLTDKLAVLGAETLLACLEDVEHLTPQAQNPLLVTYAKKINKEETLINWQESPTQYVLQQIQTFAPKPGAYMMFRGERLKILSAELYTGDIAETTEPLNTLDESFLNIATHAEGLLLCSPLDQNWILIHTVQPANKKPIPATAWYRNLKAQPSQ